MPEFTRWDKVRAGLIAFVVFVNVTAAFPTPGKITEKSIKDPEGQEELTKWVELLAVFGYETDPTALGMQVKGLADGWRGARAWFVTPFKPYFRITGTWQGWGLFAYPSEHPFTLTIDARANNEDYGEPLYRSGDWDHQYKGGLLHYRRVRACYNPGIKPPGTYNGFSSWFARDVLAEQPELDRVRFQFIREHVTLPGERPDKGYEVRFRRVRKRDATGLAVPANEGGK